MTAARNIHEPEVTAGFMTTRWSVVARSAASTAESQAALEELCRAYWFPVYAYVRKQNCSAADAEDLTQEFFAEIVRSQFLQRADPNRGRFRSYLLTSVRNHVRSAWVRATARKRGGGTETVSIHDPAVEEQFREVNDPSLDPGKAYELSWALTVLQRARERLVAEQTAKGKLHEFEQFEPFLSAAPSEGEYAAVAARLGIALNRVAVAIHRLGRRYRALLREEVAQTVEEPGETEAELAYLLKVLAR